MFVCRSSYFSILVSGENIKLFSVPCVLHETIHELRDTKYLIPAVNVIESKYVIRKGRANAKG
jgi:hypothetical protein